jgi:hypothetical protein
VGVPRSTYYDAPPVKADTTLKSSLPSACLPTTRLERGDLGLVFLKKGQWAIICTTHNLLKLFTLAKAAWPNHQRSRCVRALGATAYAH